MATNGLASIIQKPIQPVKKAEIVKNPEKFDNMEELEESREVT